MVWSGYELIRPDNETHADDCAVTRLKGNKYRITVARRLLGSRDFDKTLWLVICDVAVDDERELNFRNLIWDNCNLDSRGTNLKDHPFVSSIWNLRRLDHRFNPNESDENDRFSFDLSSELILRSYLCLEFPGRVLDGGLYATFDLPAFAKIAGAQSEDEGKKK